MSQLDEGFGKGLSRYAGQLPGISEYQHKKLAARGKVWSYLEQADGRDSPIKLLTNYLIQTEFRDSLKSMSLNDQRTEEQLLAIDGLMSYIRRFRESVGECYQHILILKQKNRDHSNNSRNRSTVTLSSSHRAKGLEWPVVLIPGLTARYWPFVREDALVGPSANDLEAERRLLYVAITRASNTLHLFTCEGDLDQFSQNWNQDKSASPSRFLIEMALSQALTFSSALHEKNEQTLLQAMEQNGITRQSRKYLTATWPELADKIQAAPSRREIWRQQHTASLHKSRQHPARQAVLGSLSPGATSKNDEPWQLHATIHHSIFGPGQVIELNDSNFVIQFDSQHGVKRFVRTEQIKHLFEVLCQ